MESATLSAASPLTSSGTEQAATPVPILGPSELTLAGVLAVAVVAMWRIIAPRYRKLEKENATLHEKLLQLSVEVASLRGELNNKVLANASADREHASELARLAAERAKYKADSESMALRNAALCKVLRDAGLEEPE